MIELKIRSTWRLGALALLFASANVLMAQGIFGGGTAGQFAPDRPPRPGALNLIKVPLPSGLSDFVVNQKAAIALGKALFWDQQVGSDGLACGSCHFHAGADNRVKNAIDPGLRNVDPAKQNIFNLTASNKNNKVGPPAGGGPNYTLKMLDYPFHQLTDITDRNSTVLFDTDDITGSAGVFRADFNSVNVNQHGGGGKHGNKNMEACFAALSPTFSVHGVNTRAVEPRNTPTVINAIFNYRNFWDGRANNIFNGRNPFGPRDPTAGSDPLNSVLAADPFGNLSPFPVALEDASLASQAVGPPGSDLEMSCRGRVFEEIGKKILSPLLRPLAGQDVSATDSVLAAYLGGNGGKGGGNGGKGGTGGSGGKGGLSIGYEALIKQAFAPQFWSSPLLSGDNYRQVEKNFSLFFGLSIMLYESTLVPDNAPFDQYSNGNISALTTQQAHGFEVFNGNGGCIFCHSNAQFSGAATDLRLLALNGARVEHMILGDGTVALYDSGFYNLGVRSPGDDIGVGGLDPWGNPLNFTRSATNAVAAGVSAVNVGNVFPDGFFLSTCNFEIDPCFPITRDARDAVDGSFKVPSLRNVELTGPYFHNGGQATLEQVVHFYNRGGDGIGSDSLNTTGFGINPTNRDPNIFPLNLSDEDQAALVAFLKSLTDERVRWEMAPFDHPGLMVPNGHPFNELTVRKNSNTVYAVDDFVIVPAVGAAGRAPLNLPALQPFAAGLQ
jgi:cytochrome c peroxidase